MRRRGERLRGLGGYRPGGAGCFPRNRRRGGPAAAGAASSGSSATGSCCGATTEAGELEPGEVPESAGLVMRVEVLSEEERARGGQEGVLLGVAVPLGPAGVSGVSGSSAKSCAERTAAISARAAASTLACRARAAGSPFPTFASLLTRQRLGVASRSRAPRGAPGWFTVHGIRRCGESSWGLASGGRCDNSSPVLESAAGCGCWQEAIAPTVSHSLPANLRDAGGNAMRAVGRSGSTSRNALRI